MASHPEAICRRFAWKDADRFEGVSWIDRPTGPALEDALAWIECHLRDEYNAGDHAIAVANVVSIEAASKGLPTCLLSRALRYLLGDFSAT